jgi:hypothetical protein
MNSNVKRLALTKYLTLHSEEIQKGFDTEKWLRMFRVYSNTGNRYRNVENDFITGFGSNFDSFNNEQLCRFTQSLTQAGLPQADIFNSVAEKINSFESGERHLRNSEFQRQHYSLINQMLDLNLHESQAFDSTLKACETIYGKTFE